MADAPTAINRAWPSALNKTRSRLSRRNDVTALDIDQRMLRVVHVELCRSQHPAARDGQADRGGAGAK